MNREKIAEKVRERVEAFKPIQERVQEKAGELREKAQVLFTRAKEEVTKVAQQVRPFVENVIARVTGHKEGVDEVAEPAPEKVAG